MRRTNRVPQNVLWSLLLGVALGNVAPAQQPPAQPIPPPAPAKEDRPTVRGNALIVPIGGTKRLQMSSKRPIVKVFNPTETVTRVSPILGDPTTVLVYGLTAGASRITLAGEGNVEETFEVVVQLDLEYLRTVLRDAVPTAAVTPVASSNNTVILTGMVAHAEDVDIILRTASAVVGGSERLINAMRVGGVMQVQLDTVVARVNRTAMRNMAFNFFIKSPSTTFQSNLNLFAGPNIAPAGQALTFPGLGNLSLNVMSGQYNILAFLEALRDEQLAKLLTEPRLVTLSGQPAFLHDGGQQAIPQPQGLGTVGVTFQDFGTDLTFIPIVLGNGKIHLDITTKVSQLDAASGTSISGTTVPGRVDQAAHTVVEMEDGQTLAIGGLIQHRTQAEAVKVPVLGDLPYIGAAFSFKTNSDQEIELVILVTPHLVDPMACNQLPKMLPGEETRSPDDCELFLEGILEAPRGPRVNQGRRFVPAYKNGPTAAVFPCAGDGHGDGHCGQPGHKAADPAGDPPSPVSRLPVGDVQAKPVPPVAATPLASPATSSSPDPAPTAEQNKSAGEQSRSGTAPATVPGPANQDDKVTR